MELVESECGDGSECPRGVDVSGAGCDRRPGEHLETKRVAVGAFEPDRAQLAAVGGIATFNNLSVNLPGTGDFLTAITTNPALSVNSRNIGNLSALP